MESALEKLSTIMEKVERNTSSKSSFYILLSKKSAKIRTQFNPLIELDAGKKYEMSLLNLETYFSFPNIDATNNHFRYSPNVEVRSAMMTMTKHGLMYSFQRGVMKSRI